MSSIYVHYHLQTYRTQGTGRWSVRGGKDMGTAKQGIYEALEESRRTLLENVKMKASIKSDLKYQELEKFLTELQYNKKFEDYDSGLTQQDMDNIRAQFINYIEKKDFYLDLDTLSEGKASTSLTHARTGEFSYLLEKGEKVYSKSLEDLKARINSILATLSRGNLNIKNAEQALKDMQDIKGRLNSLCQKLENDNIFSGEKSGTLNEKDSSILKQIVRDYNKALKLTMGQPKDWGEAAEAYYYFALQAFQNRGIKEFKDLLSSQALTNNVAWTATKQVANGLSVKAVVSPNFKFPEIATKGKDKNLHYSYKNGILDIKIQGSNQTADLEVTQGGKIDGISIKNYSLNLGGKYGIHVLSSANLLNILNLFGENFIGHFLNINSVLHKKSGFGAVEVEAVPAADRDKIKNQIALAGAIRGLTGVRSRMLNQSGEGTASLIIVNNPTKQRVNIFSTAEILNFLIENINKIDRYVEMEGYPTSKYNNDWVAARGSQTARSWIAANARSAGALSWAASHNISISLKQEVWNKFATKI